MLMRDSVEDETTFEDALRRKEPRLEEYLHLITLLTQDLLVPMSAGTGRRERDGLHPSALSDAFHFFLQLAFVHPRMFTRDSPLELSRSLEIIKDGWEDFVASQVDVDFGEQPLTEEDLKALDEEQQHRERRRAADAATATSADGAEHVSRTTRLPPSQANVQTPSRLPRQQQLAGDQGQARDSFLTDDAQSLRELSKKLPVKIRINLP